ncbi:MAG: queuosine salvage family protein [Candidatus Bipolaricaulota bacterium]|nr:queuosine salvage family protein [Candidatus Bipolaricaulota bacterium]
MRGILFDEIQNACQAVAEKATQVHIDYDRLASYAAALPLEEVARPTIDPTCHHIGHGEDTLSFFVVLDTINFGSGYFPHLRKRPGMSGYFTIASFLADHYKQNGPFSAQALVGLTTSDCARIFGQDLANHPIRELMERFAHALNDLGQFLLDRFSGSVPSLIEEADSSAERLVQLLCAMPYFNDVESYYGVDVPFYKRAQLMASDLALAFDGVGPGEFRDLDRLTIFADNLVPHVLRIDRVLSYQDELAARIGRGELIEAGSPEEVEIRACALHAVSLLAVELRNTGHLISERDLDYLLWNRGQDRGYKTIRPRHRTRTVYY